MERLLLLLVAPLMASVVVYLCVKRWVWPDLSATFKLKFKRVRNFIIGLLIMIAFFTVDFLISSIPCVLIQPKTMFTQLVCLAAFAVIFFVVIFVAVFWMSRRVKPQAIKEQDENP